MRITDNKKNSFFLFLFISFGFHVLLIVFIFISNHFWKFFGEEKQFIMPPSIRIDSIGLPDPPKKNIITEKKPIIPLPKKTEKKKDKPIKKKKEEVKKNKETEKKKITEKEKPEQEPKDSKEEVNKGNQLNKEGEKEGEEIISKDTLSAIYTYTEMIKQKIRSNWDLPKYLTEINLITQIELKISPDGSIFYKNIHSSSGNDLFDSYVLKAIETAAPYPPPPDTAKKYIQKGGFVLTVPSQN